MQRKHLEYAKRSAVDKHYKHDISRSPECNIPIVSYLFSRTDNVDNVDNACMFLVSSFYKYLKLTEMEKIVVLQSSETALATT